MATTKDGYPRGFCEICGAGYREYIECEQPDCTSASFKHEEAPTEDVQPSTERGESHTLPQKGG